MRLLLVEEDQSSRDLVAKSLEGNNVTVVKACGLIDAVFALNLMGDDIDFVLLDRHLTFGNALDIAKSMFEKGVAGAWYSEIDPDTLKCDLVMINEPKQGRKLGDHIMDIIGRGRETIPGAPA